MKYNLFLITLLAGLCTWVLPVAQAQGDDAERTEKVSKKGKKGKKAKKSKKQEEEEAPAEESVVGALLKKNEGYFNNTEPNFNAEYFIFLKSASWCGPCNMEMPGVAREYEQMKASGKVELILLSHDRTEEAAKGFLEKYKAGFPALMRNATSLPQIPEGKGIPHATIMKADGTVIEDGHGSIIRGWKAKTIGEFAIAGDDGEPRVGKAMKDIKFAGSKPNRKAEYYIYVYTPSPDKSTISTIADKYKDMKKAKVEVIYITRADSPAELNKALKASKARIPAVAADADGVSELPGLGSLGSTPQALMVTQSGATAISGGSEVLNKWEKVVEANK